MHHAVEAPSIAREFYPFLAEQLSYLIGDETDRIAALANASALFREYLKAINWVGFYLVRGEELVLGPFQGKPACVRIGWGKGVCGTAAKEDRALVVPDVQTFPGHIACDSDSRSELVIPLHVDRQVIAVLDIDSPTVARFTEEDAGGLLLSVKVLERVLSRAL
ncbi:GAF domain-containing protein [Ferroacidibacillus organovorans]|uniref:GAF domain-containing protein n=1 Tax=Ferroacidibacillus organovorans TaxID=1765683 RepID=A0A162TK35_9BACL|nr:GAF domain-containing protein [Ferroacidibacillus organovorans]KYP80886.1 hypothetical protein AYJ22_01655 [Ferroacidibacillus organovorans]OAG95431.1 hypothetical protein AYW79_00535 [Ferroacidibacillus organovorans]OPG17564.1 hypothetical protein B2M26_00960 [Ferroacidibacillus organovorans]